MCLAPMNKSDEIDFIHTVQICFLWLSAKFKCEVLSIVPVASKQRNRHSHGEQTEALVYVKTVAAFVISDSEIFE